MIGTVSRLVALRSFFFSVVAALTACGGSGGGGGGSSQPVSISPASLSVSAAVNSATPASAQVNLGNIPANGNYVAWQFSGNGVATVSVDAQSASTAIVSVVYKPPGALLPGTYSDQIDVKFCTATPCTNAIPGTAITVPVTYTVTPVVAGSEPTVSFAQTQLSYQDLLLDAQPPPQLIDTMTLANFGETPYFSISGVGSVVVNAQAYAQGLSTGTLTVQLTPPINMSAGTTTISLQITACLDPNCVNPVAGSPFTVNVAYTVGDTISVSGPQGYTLSAMTLLARTLVWDAAHGKLVVLLPVGTNSVAHIATLDPTTKVLGPEVALNDNGTGGIAVSDDGQYLYVGVVNGTIQRFRLPGLTPDLVISMGADGQGHQLNGVDIKVAPGAPHTIAVVQSLYPYAGGGPPNEAGVAIFDDAIQRPNRLSGTLVPATPVDFISWGSNAQTLFATSYAHPGLYSLTADAQGFSGSANQGAFIGTPLHFANGFLYLDGGQIVDGSTSVVTHELSAYSNLYGVLTSVSNSKLFVSNSDVSSVGAPHLHSLDLTTFGQNGDLQLTNLFNQQQEWLLLTGGGLAAPMIVIHATSYIGFIAGGFVGP